MFFGMALILLHRAVVLQLRHLKSMLSPKINQNSLSKSQLPSKIVSATQKNIFEGVSFFTALYPDTNRMAVWCGAYGKTAKNG
jgi:hypothetical protein